MNGLCRSLKLLTGAVVGAVLAMMGSAHAQVVGTCCLPNGAAVQSTLQQCTSQGGIYLGVIPPSSADVCFRPCCRHNFWTCTLENVHNCQPPNLMIWFQETCNPIPCNEGNGACCKPDSTCVLADKDTCEAQHLGTWFGFGSTCPSIVCESGACCTALGECRITTLTACIGLGHGTWFGLGSTCTPDLCSQRGACCRRGGTCSITTVAECSSDFLVFQGIGTTCTPGICGGDPLGACCKVWDCTMTLPAQCSGSFFPNATCTPLFCQTLGVCCFTTGVCSTVPQVSCPPPNTFYAGTLNCGQVNWCAPVSGLCCFKDNCFAPITEKECREMGGGVGGTFHPGATLADCDRLCKGGACCCPSGGCTVVEKASDCQHMLLAGTTSCNPDPCGEALKTACCLPDNTCFPTTLRDCLDRGGRPTGTPSATCQPSSCTSKTGVCCTGQPTITIVTPDECAALGGVFIGNPGLFPGDPCADCNWGGCCLSNGRCVMTSYTQCKLTENASWLNGEPCKPSGYCGDVGACCYMEVARISAPCTVISQQECERYAGSMWLGSGTACDPDPCILGACCDEAGRTCTLEFQPNCREPLKFFAGITCSPNPCVTRGACCVQTSTSSTCYDAMISDECRALGGTFYPNQSCAEIPCIRTTRGACCAADGSCNQLTSAQCRRFGGQFLGVGTICTPNPCPRNGACCLQAGGCTITGPNGCTNGVFQGVGTVCTPNPCPVYGGCCYPVGMGVWVCAEPLTASECALQGIGGQATFYPNQTCSAIFCGPRGACCDTLGNCTLQDRAVCLKIGGIYQGDNTACTPNPCPRRGACCTNKGSCTVTTQQECCGVWLGSGVPCLPDTCAQGACCNGCTGNCTVLTQHQCTALGATFLGSGSVCAGQFCSPPRGACCIGSTCSILPLESCSSGRWTQATTCAPNPCCPGDENGDGVVNALDLSIAIDRFFVGCP